MGEIIDDEARAVADSMVKAYAPEASKRIEELEKENQELKAAMARAAAALEVCSRFKTPMMIFEAAAAIVAAVRLGAGPAPAQTFKPGSAEEIRP